MVRWDNIGYGGTLGTNYPFIFNVTFNAPDSQHPLLLPNSSNAATIENALVSVNLQDPTVNTGQGLNLYGRELNCQTPYVQVMNLTVQDQVSAARFNPGRVRRIPLVVT